MKRFFFIGQAVLAGLLVTLAGCRGKDRVPEYLAKADAAWKAGEYEKAETLYQTVLRTRAEQPGALRSLGLMYLQLGQFERAAVVLVHGRDALTNDVEIRSGLARAYYATGATKSSRDEVLQVLRLSPGHDHGLLLLADLAANTNETAAARRLLEEARRQAGDKPALHAALGTLWMKEGAPAKASEEFALAAKAPAPPAIVLAALAGFAWSQGDLTNAEAYYRKAVAAEPAEPLRQFQLAEFKLKTGPVAEGKAMLAALGEKYPRVPMIWYHLADIAAQEGVGSDCKNALAKLFACDPFNLSGRLLLARLRVASGAFDAAALELERLSRFYPKSAPLFHQLGVAHLMGKDMVKALASFDRALAADPGYQNTILAMADLNIRRADYASAVTSLRSLISKHPELYQGYLMLADAYRLRGTPLDSLEVYKRLEKFKPEDPSIPYVTGLTLRTLGRTAEARAQFARVLELAPLDTSVLTQLADMDLAAGQTNDAIARVTGAAAKHPDSIAHQMLLAQLHMTIGRLDAAETVLAQILEKYPENVEAYGLQARVYVAGKKQQQALERLASGLLKRPQDPVLLIQQGVIYDLLKQFDRARESYEQVLRVNPEHVLAMNNLACLLSEQFNQLDKAYELARKAHELNPANPSAADSLGWILFKRREYPWALSLIREAASRLPGEPEVQYHLGLAHYMMGEEGPAKAALERSLAGPGEFRGRAEVSKWLGFLKAESGADDEQVVGLLEKRLAEEPSDSVAMRRMAGVYERRGQADKALGLYEQALKQNPKAVVPLLRLAEYYGTRLRQRDKALEYAKRAHNAAPDDPVVSQTLGRLAFDAGDHKWAFSLLQESARRQPGQPELLFDLGRCHYALGRASEAETAVRAALGSPEFTRTNEAGLFLEMAALARNPEQALAAKDRVAAVLKASPVLLPALLARGAAEERAGKPDDALKTYESVLSVYESCLPAIRRLAVLYAARDEVKRGFDLAKRAREAYPNDDEVTQALGRIVFLREDFPFAARLFADVVRTQPTNASAHYLLGLSQARLKGARETKATLNRALELEPGHALAGEARRVLKELK